MEKNLKKIPKVVVSEIGKAKNLFIFLKHSGKVPLRKKTNVKGRFKSIGLKQYEEPPSWLNNLE